LSQASKDVDPKSTGADSCSNRCDANRDHCCDANASDDDAHRQRHLNLSKHLTINKDGKSYWYMLEPLLMSKTIFDALPKDQQLAIMQVGAEMEKFALEGARADDHAISQAYAKAGATVHDLPEAALQRWVALSRETAWKDYASKNETCARFLKLADQVK